MFFLCCRSRPYGHKAARPPRILVCVHIQDACTCTGQRIFHTPALTAASQADTVLRSAAAVCVAASGCLRTRRRSARGLDLGDDLLEVALASDDVLFDGQCFSVDQGAQPLECAREAAEQAQQRGVGDGAAPVAYLGAENGRDRFQCPATRSRQRAAGALCATALASAGAAAARSSCARWSPLASRSRPFSRSLRAS